MINIYDFEGVARKVMTKEAWDYYSSGADDEVTLRENHAAFQRVSFTLYCSFVILLLIVCFIVCISFLMKVGYGFAHEYL